MDITAMKVAEYIPEDSLDENSWDDDVECLEGYQPGGYHPVTIGQVLGGRYSIVHKLGHGGYSTVWLARDTVREEYVAVKVSTERAERQEISTLYALSQPSEHPGRSLIPCPLDEFVISGPNGRHLCYTMVPGQGDLTQVMPMNLHPLDVTRSLIGELVMAVAYTHSRGYVHGNIQPSNILVGPLSNINHLSIQQFYERYGTPSTEPIQAKVGKSLPSNIPPTVAYPLCTSFEKDNLTLSDAHILLVDFHESFSPSLENRLLKENCMTVILRPPEFHFEPLAPFTFSSDIWSLAIAIWYIVGMNPLLGGGGLMGLTPDNMICELVDLLGPLPTKWSERWEKKSDFFNEQGLPRSDRYLFSSLEKKFDRYVQMYRQEVQAGEFGGEEKRAFLEFMRHMLAFDPSERATVEDLLQSEWMVNWVMPDMKRASQAKEVV